MPAKFLIPGLLGVVLMFDRFSNIGSINNLETSLYLGPIQRMLDGQMFDRDFKPYFGPNFFIAIESWMRWFGYTYNSLVQFFVFGWCIFTMLLGILCAQAFRSIGLACLAVAFVVIFGFPEPFQLRIWGGPRYVPGLLTIVLVNAAFLYRTMILRCTFVSLAVLLVLTGTLIAAEQILVALIAFGSALVFQLIVAGPRSIVVPGIVIKTVVFSTISSVCLIFAYLRRHGLVLHTIEHFRDLPAYSIWLSPGQLTLIHSFSFLGVALALVLLAINAKSFSYTTQGQPRSFVKLTSTIFCIWYYLYGLRAPQQAQFVLGQSIFFIVVLLQVDSVMSHRATSPMGFMQRVVLIAALSLTFLCSSRWNPVAAINRSYNRIVANWSGTPLLCRNGCRMIDSSVYRMAGTILPKEQAEDIEQIVVALSDKLQNGAKYFIFPEAGFLQFVLNKSTVSRFPVAVLAHTKPEWSQELVELISSDPPDFIVRGRNRSGLSMSIGAQEELLPDVAALIEENYRIDVRLNNFEILSRK